MSQYPSAAPASTSTPLFNCHGLVKDVKDARTLVNAAKAGHLGHIDLAIYQALRNVPNALPVDLHGRATVVKRPNTGDYQFDDAPQGMCWS